jgi:hypothetical protein
MMRFIASLLLVCPLVACGGGGGGADANKIPDPNGNTNANTSSSALAAAIQTITNGVATVSAVAVQPN